MKKSILLAVALLSACLSQQKIMNSWLGSTKQNLIMSWGPPDRIASDGGTGEILVYATLRLLARSQWRRGFCLLGL